MYLSRFNYNLHKSFGVVCNTMLNVFTDYIPASYECRVDVILVIDSSVRMSVANNSEIINFIQNVVYGLQLSDNNTRIGFISFNEFDKSIVS